MPSIGHWRKILNIRRQDDDKQLNAIILAKLDNEHVYVQVSPDKSQAGGRHERHNGIRRFARSDSLTPRG